MANNEKKVPEAQEKKELKELRDLKPKKDVNGGARNQGIRLNGLRLAPVKSIL